MDRPVGKVSQGQKHVNKNFSREKIFSPQARDAPHPGEGRARLASRKPLASPRPPGRGLAERAGCPAKASANGARRQRCHAGSGRGLRQGDWQVPGRAARQVVRCGREACRHPRPRYPWQGPQLPPCWSSWRQARNAGGSRSGSRSMPQKAWRVAQTSTMALCLGALPGSKP